MKTIAVIQARMGSSRLPGKVMMPLAGIPSIVHTIRRVKRIPNLAQVIVATGESEDNRVLIDVAEKEGVEASLGSVENVLERFYFAVAKHSPDAVVRFTGDCPMIDPEVSNLVIREHKLHGYDYTSNTRTRTYPRGLDTEVISFKTLKMAYQCARDPFELEHVTPYVFQRPDRFKIGQYVGPLSQSKPELRLTVDTVEDFQLAEVLFSALYKTNPFFGVDEILQYLRENPDLKKINAHVFQKAT